VRFGLGIHLTAAVADTYFSPRAISAPGTLRLPLSPGLLFRSITAFAGVDFAGLDGWRYHAPGAPPEGYRIDGAMDPGELAFDARGDWFVLADADAAILVSTTMSENLRQGVRVKLLYLDDAGARLPPERVPGAGPLVGYRGLGVERLAAGRYTFRLSIVVLDGYRPGEESAALDRPHAPALAVSVERSG
jgi:hypothetical protein